LFSSSNIFYIFFTALADVAIFLARFPSFAQCVTSRQHDKSLSDGQWTAQNLADLLDEPNEWLGKICGTFFCIFCGLETA
jgi:hypothetical protein